MTAKSVATESNKQSPVGRSAVVKKSPTTEPEPESKTDLTEKQKSDDRAFEEYKPYVKELQGGFWRVLVFFATGAVIGMSYYQKILTFITGLFQLDGVNLVLTSPYQFINLAINTGFFIGVILAAPVFLHYLLQFTKPALKTKEFKLLTTMLPISIILFIVGFGFGVWVLQYVVDLFSKTSGGLDIDNIWDLSGFFSQVIIMGMSLAFLFQIPIIMTILLRLKIVTPEKFKEKRRPIYAGLLIFAAILPPTDLIALGLLTIIPLFLFEITLLLNQNTV